MKTAECHPDRKHCAKGLCQLCYRKRYYAADREKYQAIARDWYHEGANAQNRAERGIRHRKTLIEMFGGKCTRCGYDKCFAALEFHHRDKNLKLFSVSERLMCGLKTLVAEAAKCDLLCSNCHREIEEQGRHAGNSVGHV